jgi:hypothetical protein
MPDRDMLTGGGGEMFNLDLPEFAILLAVVAPTTWALVEAARAGRGLWVLLIVSFPLLGAILWFVMGRSQASATS